MKKIILISALAIALLCGCTPQEPVDEISEEEIMEDFAEMVSGEYDEADILNFADDNIMQLSADNVSRILLKLESTQRKMEAERMAQLFEGDTQQRLRDQSGEAVISSPADVDDQDLKQTIERMKDRGYVLIMMEGDYYPVINYEKYKDYYEGAGEDIKAYINIMAAEFGEFAMRDAHVAISMDNLLGRIMNAENFLESYPDSKKFEEIKELYSYYAGAYLYGMAFDPVSNTLSEEASKSYEKALQLDYRSNFAILFKIYYETLENEGFKLTDSVELKRNEMLDDLLDKYDVE